MPVGNALHRIAVGEAQNDIVAAFGGFTGYRGEGAWTSPTGKAEREDVVIVDIAYEPSKENDAKLHDIAWQFLKNANQVEVYLRYGNGHVQMVQELSCMNNGEFEWEALAASVGRVKDDLTDIPDEAEHVELTAVEEDTLARAVRG